MASFIAHYRSANASSERAKGSFEFKSEHRLGSKANEHDARVRMLEILGNQALGFTIDRIERVSAAKSSKNTTYNGQLELDFRDPIDHKERKRRRSTRRGIV